jgi:hypothetical protein
VVRELPSEEYSIKVAGYPAGTKNFIHFGLKKNKKDRKTVVQVIQKQKLLYTK